MTGAKHNQVALDAFTKQAKSLEALKEDTPDARRQFAELLNALKAAIAGPKPSGTSNGYGKYALIGGGIFVVLGGVVFALYMLVFKKKQAKGEGAEDEESNKAEKEL